MSLTPDQDRAVHLAGRDVCVLAGAGSGKTRVLVERIVWLVLREEDPLPLSSVLAITFTEKAAREMKERLAAAFLARGRSDARAEVEWAWVGTIHGFCSRLLRENAVEAGVDPSFDVLDGTQAGTLLGEVVEEVSGRWSGHRPEERAALLRLGLPDSSLVDALAGFYEELRGRGIPPAEAPVAKADPARLRGAIEGVLALVEEAEDLAVDTTARGREMVRAVSDAAGAVRRLDPRDPGFRDAADALEALDLSFNLRTGGDPLKEVLRELREQAIPRARRVAAESLSRPGLLALRSFLAEVDALYSRRKDDLGSLDFSDLETRARALLAGRPDVREAVRDRFRAVLVDEYQDVNPVQAAIVGLVRGEGNHFAVGDVKQSIYGFRHAEPSIFRARADEAGPEGRVEPAENFRSAPGLVAFTNHCFSRLFAGRPLVEWRDMVAAAGYDPPAGPEVEVMLVPGEDAGGTREAEAEALARRIRRIVDDGELVLRRHAEGRRGRPARFGDVAVLFRALSDVKLYERAFEDLDVPYHVVKGRGFYQARELVDLARLLATVVNPLDEVSLAAALRSPFGGLTDGGLLALSLRRGRRGLLGDLLRDPGAAAALAGGDAERFERFCRLHSRLRTVAAAGTIREIVEAALEESGYGTAVWGFRGGRRRAANLRKALGLADSFEGLFDLPEFVEALSGFRAREVKETEAPTGGEQEDVVRILSIHAAKGLEFPVVFLPDLSRRPYRPVPSVLLGPDGLAARAAEEAGGEMEETEAWAAGRAAGDAAEEEEGLRLLYVAVTRAEEKLFLSAREGDEGRPPGSFWSLLSPHLAFEGDRAPYGAEGRAAVLVPARAGPPPVRRVTVTGRNLARLAVPEPLTPPPEDARARARDLLLLADRPRPRPDSTAYENTVSELLAFTDCPGCWYDRFVLGLREEWEGAGEEETEPRGADELPPRQRGSLVHEVLRNLSPGEEPDPAHGEDVAAMVRSFYECPVGLETLAAPPEQVRREVPFLVRWPVPAPRRDLILRGQIDLLYPRPDGTLRVVDYKTGGPSDAYRVQLAVYARALGGLAGGRVEAAIVYLSPDAPARVEEVVLDATLDGHVERTAAEFAAVLQAGAEPPPAHGAGCATSRRTP